MIRRREIVKGVISLAALSASACASRNLKTPKASSDLRVGFLTDIHAIPDLTVPARLQHAASIINSYNCDLLLVGGDLISEGLTASAGELDQNWRCYQEFHSALAGEKYCAVGNHDLSVISKSQTGKERFLTELALPQSYYSFTALGHRIIVLDSLTLNAAAKEKLPVTDGDSAYRGEVSLEQLEWLKAELSSLSRSTPIIVMTHMPLVTVRYQVSDGATMGAAANRVVTNNREVLALFANHNLKLVLQGHLHVYEEIRWRDTLFITGGAISGGWWRGDWLGTPAGFCVLDLKSDKLRREYVVT